MEKLFDECITTERETNRTGITVNLLSVIYLLYIGYERFAHVQYVKDDPVFQRMVGLERIPVQSSFWRFFNMSLGGDTESQLRQGAFLRCRVACGKRAMSDFVGFILIRTRTVETVYGEQENACVGYNPTHRGKKSYQPVHQYNSGDGRVYLRSTTLRDTISGQEIADILTKYSAICHLPLSM